MIASPDHKHIGLPRREGVALPVLDGHNGKATIMLLKVDELSHTSGVVTLGDHDERSHLELVDLRHLARGNVNLNSVVDLDVGVGITQSASVVGDGDRNLLGSHVNLLDTTQLERGLFLVHAMKHKSSLGVEQQTEAIAALLELHDVHESRGVVVVGTDLAVNLDATLHADLLAFLAGECVLETLAKNDGDGEALTLLVGACGGLGGPDSGHLGHVPVLGRIQALEVLLRSARHGCCLIFL
mmetsp:Transcript_39734/g.95586  ORF Transcript_39734/g.95586 Transcript_39734/m.95586 type:complete len:241 (-) Transcript_39734:64-786(-)